MSKPKSVEIGTLFGALEVVSKAYSYKSRMACDCKCIHCESVGRRMLKDLFAGKTKSCGCWRQLQPVTQLNGVKIKKCNKCQTTKSLTEFAKQLKGRAHICKACMNKYSKQYRQRPAFKTKRANRRVAKKQQLMQLLGVTSCSRCPENHLVCLDFHHTEDNKEHSVCTLLKDGKASFALALEEARKCIVLCSNCHRKEHHPDIATVVIS